MGAELTKAKERYTAIKVVIMIHHTDTDTIVTT
jgi:hypothetical protein